MRSIAAFCLLFTCSVSFAATNQSPSSARAYSLNVTAVPHKTLGYLSIWPTGQSQPLVSTLNAYTGTVTANASIVEAGTSGDVSVFAQDDSDVILDVNDYFAPAGTGGLSLYPVAPCRVIDTRQLVPPFPGTLTMSVEGGSCAPPSTAAAYVLNGTVVPSAGFPYLSLWPARASRWSQPSMLMTQTSLPIWPSCLRTTATSTPTPAAQETSSSTLQATSPPKPTLLCSPR
jgi:hypothetical protein